MPAKPCPRLHRSARSERALATFLEAHLLLAEGHPAEAAASFQGSHRSTAGPVPPPLPRGGSRPGRRPPRRGNPGCGRPISCSLSFRITRTRPCLRDSSNVCSMACRNPPEPSDPGARTLGAMDHPQRTPGHRRDHHLGFLRRHGLAEHHDNQRPARVLALHPRHGTAPHPTPRQPAPRPGACSPASGWKTLTTSSPTAPCFKPPAGRSTEGAIERAFGILDTLRETANSPVMRGEAAFLQARVHRLAGRSAPGHPAVR